MSILQSSLAQYGGLGGAAKQGQKQMSILEMLGLGNSGPGYTAPIGPTQPGQTPMTGESIDPNTYAQQQSSQLAELGNRLGTWGAGVSKASGPSRIPVDFGQVLAGGTDALQAQDQQGLANQKTQAEIVALGTKGKPDFDETAQNALIKRNMGIALTPQDEATLQAWDTINQSKSSFGTDALGNLRMTPRASILNSGGSNVAPAGGGQSPRGLPASITPEKLDEYKRMRGM